MRSREFALCSGSMVGTGRKGRRKGVTVRAGSVADARKEAGLTLAEVARGKVSRTAIHLIEKGRALPSMETLEHIAEQTHKPLSSKSGATTKRRRTSSSRSRSESRKSLARPIKCSTLTLRMQKRSRPAQTSPQPHGTGN
jgi:transcriptional regulator with XRE-family HTH domain